MVLNSRDSSSGKVFVQQTAGPDLTSQHLCRKPGRIVHLCNPISQRQRQRGGGALCALTRQPNLLSSCLRKERGRPKSGSAVKNTQCTCKGPIQVPSQVAHSCLDSGPSNSLLLASLGTALMCVKPCTHTCIHTMFLSLLKKKGRWHLRNDTRGCQMRIKKAMVFGKY